VYEEEFEDDGDRKGFEVMTSSQQTGPFGSVASLLTTSPNQGNHPRNKLEVLWKGKPFLLH
jgi:hypothetical protein